MQTTTETFCENGTSSKAAKTCGILEHSVLFSTAQALQAQYSIHCESRISL